MKTYIRHRRDELNLNASQAALRSELSLSTYIRIERSDNLRAHPYNKIENIAQAFGLTVEELIKNDEEFKENGDNYDTN